MTLCALQRFMTAQSMLGVMIPAAMQSTSTLAVGSRGPKRGVGSLGVLLRLAITFLLAPTIANRTR